MIRDLKMLVFSLVIGLATVFSAPSAEARFPSRVRANETAEQSLARIAMDETTGRAKLASIDKDIEKLLGPKRFKAYQEGKCSNFKCTSGIVRAALLSLDKKRTKIAGILKDLSHEGDSLRAMTAQMNSPIQTNPAGQIPAASTGMTISADANRSPANSAAAIANQQVNQQVTRQVQRSYQALQ